MLAFIDRQVLGMKEVGFVGEALTKAERALKAAEIGLSNSDGSGIGIGKEVLKATQVSITCCAQNSNASDVIMFMFMSICRR